MYKIILLLSTVLVFSQQIPKSENICFFKDAKSGLPITIINDSLIYKGTLKNPTILKHTEYPESLSKYNYHFNINKHTYLVHEGCGVVLEYRNDSIVRIDNSFLQKNQYGALPFVYNKQICLFGGYGLFTNKNIITHYSFKLNEWFELPTKEENRPTPRSSSNGIITDKSLFLFGGCDKTVPSTYEKEKNLYQLNLKTLDWSVLGEYNEALYDFISKSVIDFSFCANNKLYFLTNEQIVEIDVLNNKVIYYKNNDFISSFKMYYDDSTKNIVALNNLSAYNHLVENIQPLQSVLKHPIKTETFYVKPYTEYMSLFGIVLLLSIVSYFSITYFKNKNYNQIVYVKSKKKFFYKSKPLSNLDIMEEKFLLYLLEHSHQFIQLNQLNIFFENDKQDNFAAVVKKRDLVFNSLLFKLNSIFHIEEDQIIISQKNETDKRIKEIKLNSDFFKEK